MSDLRRFRRQPHSRARGAHAEERAVQWLTEQGYRIQETNFTCRIGEIDVIARDGETLCFIEVKARATHSHGPAVAAVTVSKRKKILRTASWYLAQKPFEGPCRFDVLGLDPALEGWSFTLVRDAFGVDY